MRLQTIQKVAVASGLHYDSIILLSKEYRALWIQCNSFTMIFTANLLHHGYTFVTQLSQFFSKCIDISTTIYYNYVI